MTQQQARRHNQFLSRAKESTLTIALANVRDLLKNETGQTERPKLKVQTHNPNTTLPTKRLLAHPECWRRSDMIFTELLICRITLLPKDSMQPNETVEKHAFKHSSYTQTQDFNAL